MSFEDSAAAGQIGGGMADPGADVSALSVDGAPDSGRATAQAKEAIGPYRLLDLIGSGGMGEVWLAEQTYPVRRHVAIKLIKTGMDTREVVARFHSERQALALMNHASIAKVFDAGATREGRPYFVMEYISGVPITEYCDQHRLSLGERLVLFVQVCDAVQHAHQKAIIHRDLKPSNILVEEVDGKAVPRVIDFGIAKAISQGLLADTQFTHAGAILGTPLYMSPEQADSGGVDVDTRTDVYSLGAVLYELLAGARPFDFQQLPFDDILRRLREQEPIRPSTKLQMSDVAAENRCCDAGTLARQVRGDLDAITLKALAKERSRRYASPSDLAADIERHLRHEAVTAVPPSLTYRAGKFALRYRAGLTIAAAFVLVLLLAALFIVRQSIRAKSEAATAQAISDFLQRDLLAQASAAAQSGPSAKPDPDLKVRTALDRAAVKIARRFEHQPGIEAAIRATIGHAYMDLGLYPEAWTQLERALVLERRIARIENPETLRTMSTLGWIAWLEGKYPEAETLLKQTLELQRHVLGPEHSDTLSSMNDLANVYLAQGRYAQAEALHKKTLELRRRVLGPEHRDTLVSMNNLAGLYASQGKYAQAEALDSQTLELRRRVLGSEHPETVMSMNNLAIDYETQGKFAQAAMLFSQALKIDGRVLGPRHPDVLRAMSNLAEADTAQGKYAQAGELYRENLEMTRRVLGPEHPDTLGSMDNLANLYAVQGKYAQAESLFSQTLGIQRRVLGAGHPDSLLTLSCIASVHQRTGKYALAEAYAAQVLAGRRHALGSEHPDTMASVADLALADLSQGKFHESEPLAREALEFYRTKQPDNWQRFRAESLLGASLAGQKKYAEAEPLLLEGYQGMLAQKDRIDVPDWYHLDLAREWLIELYRDWGKPEKAAEWRKK